MNTNERRRTVATAASALAELTPGTTGNLSVRDGEQFVVTPTGVAYDEVTTSDTAVVTLAGEHVTGPEPSSETPMHRHLYRETDAGAVVHTHSPWATTLAVAREPLPPVHYMLAHAGGRVPVADYETYGTTALAEAAARAMETAGTTATLLADHGVVACGSDLAAAVETARAVETTAQLYCRARLVGEAVTLPDAEIDRVAAKFADYGQPEE